MIPRLLTDERGSEMTEAVVTIPIMVTLLLGLVQLGIVVYGAQMAKEAARHGARVGSVAQTNAAARAHVAAAQFADSAFPIGSPNVQILAPGGIVGSRLRVRVSYDVQNIMGGMPGLPSGPFQVSGEATARQEGW
jgi:Flp pilus assembly protein TadG